jgi:uncharacterized membrane protein
MKTLNIIIMIWLGFGIIKAIILLTLSNESEQKKSETTPEIKFATEVLSDKKMLPLIATSALLLGPIPIIVAITRVFNKKK